VHDLRRLLALARPQRPAFLSAALVGLMVSLLYLTAAALVARALSRLMAGQPLADVGVLLALAAAVVLARAVAIFGQDALAARAAGAVKTALRERLTAKVLDLGPGWLTAQRSGQVQSMLIDGVERLEKVYSRLLTQTAVSFAVGLGTCGWLLALDAVVGTVVLVCLLLMPGTVVLTRYAMRRTGLAWWGTYSGMYAEYLDAVQGMPTLKVLGASRLRGQQLREQSDLLRDEAIELSRKEIAFSLLVGGAVGVATALAVAIGALRVASGQLPPADLLLVLLLVRECFRPVDALLAGFHAAYHGLLVAGPILRLLDTAPFVSDSGARVAQVRRGTRSPELALEAVRFAYPGRPGWALDGLDLRIEPGEALALVGPSGAGKSTVASLLLRFWDPQQGRLLLDGVDIRDRSLADLRAHVALVSQDTHLLHGTVADNLRLARPDATDRQLWATLADAAAEDLVRALPQGLHTLVGERGVRLSGGERQRIAIARALLKDAPVLVLDEATSSLDVRNEAFVQAGLERLRLGRTTLVIAHRLSTVATADRVLVLDAGRTVEQGSPGELASAGGQFSRLTAAQQVAP